MAKIRQSNLDETVITGLPELTTKRADNDQIIIYDASGGGLKKISASNVAFLNPLISSISPTNVTTGDGTGNVTFTVTGSGFGTDVTAVLITDGGSEVAFTSVTRDSSSQLTCVIPKSSLSNANEPYDIKVTSTNISNTLADQVNIDAQPVFTTSAGSLGSSRYTMSGVEVNATDPESAGNVTFELQSGTLPPGISITNTSANGGTATFTGTITPQSSETTYNFVLRAVDAASNTSSRSFSFTALGPQVQSFTSSGTFSVPTGATSADVLVVAGGGGGGGAPFSNEVSGGGGGGGGGGLIFFPSYPITPGGTLTVTVGCGGVPSPDTGAVVGTNGQDSSFGSPSDPGLGTGGVLTAKGGGGGGAGSPGSPVNGATGGSGGGNGGGPQPEPGDASMGNANQPTQPGNSGAYGFGGDGRVGNTNSNGGGGGGGGASGVIGNCGGFSGGPGGNGKAYTIADGTTSVYYAGGGGGSSGSPNSPGSLSAGVGGQGGGGNGAAYIRPNPGTGAQNGQANKGGGGGGGGSGDCGTSATFAKNGGKGIVIVRY